MNSVADVYTESNYHKLEKLKEDTMLHFIRLPELVRQQYSGAAVYAERFNAYSHFAGIVLSVFFSGWAFSRVFMAPTPAKIVSVTVYSISMILLYSMSGVYHILPAGRMKRFFRVLDHSTIFLLIAGCYTPFCAVCLWGYPIGKFILVFEWILAAVGIGLNLRDMNSRPVKIFSQICYVVMGWMVVFAMRLLIMSLPMAGIIWLAAGGICYTVGILFYALGKKNCVMHCIWHVWVLLGSVFQFISISMIL
ncbi:MAG: hemolysin III family protein [Eubacteriales bacterium]|nr:hemolysin III family protein [Eubacteriales bacterium]